MLFYGHENSTEFRLGGGSCYNLFNCTCNGHVAVELDWFASAWDAANDAVTYCTLFPVPHSCGYVVSVAVNAGCLLGRMEANNYSWIAVHVV